MLTAAPNDEKTEAGTELTARIGIKQRDTHVAWTMNAPKKLGGLFLISSNRLSLPSALIRWKRYVPSLAAQMDTAALSATCLQLKA